MGRGRDAQQGDRDSRGSRRQPGHPRVPGSQRGGAVRPQPSLSGRQTSSTAVGAPATDQVTPAPRPAGHSPGAADDRGTGQPVPVRDGVLAEDAGGPARSPSRPWCRSRASASSRPAPATRAKSRGDLTVARGCAGTSSRRPRPAAGRPGGEWLRRPASRAGPGRPGTRVRRRGWTAPSTGRHVRQRQRGTPPARPAGSCRCRRPGRSPRCDRCGRRAVPSSPRRRRRAARGAQACHDRPLGGVVRRGDQVGDRGLGGVQAPAPHPPRQPARPRAPAPRPGGRPAPSVLTPACSRRIRGAARRRRAARGCP